MNVDMEGLNSDLWYNLESCSFVLKAIPKLAMCLDVGTGVMEGSTVKSNCCILFNIT